jgi:hypothetical protein
MSVQVSQRHRIAPIEPVRQSRSRREVAFAVTKQNYVGERPMPAFREHEVEFPVTIQFTDTDVRSGLGNGLQGSRSVSFNS